jgi:hypothetical protein
MRGESASVEYAGWVERPSLNDDDSTHRTLPGR